MDGAGNWLGIDLGASTIHAVLLTAEQHTSPARLAKAVTFEAADVDGVVGLAASAQAIAIDAPSSPSRGVHTGQPGRSAKFSTARCGEIALGEQLRIWVPWTTPTDATLAPGWMQVGFALWAALRDAGQSPIEVYPAGLFTVLAGGRLPKKTTNAGLSARINLLERHATLPPGIQMWSHDGVDALGAALVAGWSTQGRARAIVHDGTACDASSIWVPALAEGE